MRCLKLAVCLAFIVALHGRAEVFAQAPGSRPAVPTERSASYEQLQDLGAAVRNLASYTDNVFAYARRKAEIEEQATSFWNSKLMFAVEVERVTTKEVIVRVQRAGGTRIVLQHPEAPLYGKLGTLDYPSTPSTQWTKYFAKPVAFRLGREIPLSLAQKVRRGDALLVRGHIDAVHLWIDGAFEPLAVAVIADWVVSTADDTVDPRDNR